jgi:hypothetical protein
MSIFLDKIVGGIARTADVLSNPFHQKSDEEKAREAKYARVVSQYKKLVLKWHNVDGISEKTLRRLGFWDDNLMKVQVQAMKGPGGGPGGLIPILTPGGGSSANELSVVTAQEVSRVEELNRQMGRIQEAIEEEVQVMSAAGREFDIVGLVNRLSGNALSQQRARDLVAKFNNMGAERSTKSMIELIFEYMNPPVPIAYAPPEEEEGKHETGGEPEPERKVAQPPPASSSSSSSSSSAAAAQQPPPRPGTIATRIGRFALYPSIPSGGGFDHPAQAREAQRLKDEGKVVIKSTPLRDALTHILKQKGGLGKDASKRQAALLDTIKGRGYWGSERAGRVLAVLEAAGALEGLQGDASKEQIAEAIMRIGPSALTQAFATAGITEPEELKPVPQTGPGYTPEVEAKGTPAAFIIEHKKEIAQRYRDAGMSDDAIEAILEALATTAHAVYRQVFTMGVVYTPADANRYALAELRTSLERVLREQQGIFGANYASTREIDRLARDAVNQIPWFIKRASESPLTGAARLAGALPGRVNTSRYERGTVEHKLDMMGSTAAGIAEGTYEAIDRANAALRGTQPSVGSAGSEILVFDADELEEVKLVADEVKATISTTPQGLRVPRTDARVIQRLMNAIRSQVPSAGTALRMPRLGLSIKREPASPLDINEDYEGFEEEGHEFYPLPGGPPDGGPGGPPGGGPGGGGGGIYRWTLRLRGQVFRLRTLAALIAILVSIGGGYGITQAIADGLKDVISGKSVSVDDILENRDETKTEQPTSNNGLLPNGSYNAPPSGVTDAATYEYGPDGRPRLFPSPNPNTSISYVRPMGPLPIENKRATYRVVSPELPAPGSTSGALWENTVGGFDTENEDIVRLMADRPDIALHIQEFNATAEKYNAARTRGDAASVESSYKDLLYMKTVIDNEVRGVNAFTGSSSYGAKPPASEYASRSRSGKPITLKAHKEKNARTARLGLDKRIDSYNKAVDVMNRSLINDEEPTDSSRVARATYESELKAIQDIEGSPSNAIGTVRPKLIEEKYPKRVQELANKALANEIFTITMEDQALLEQYPEIGKPVLQYVEFRKRYPHPGTTPSINVQKELDKVRTLSSQGYLLPAQRGFAEGLHTAPASVQGVIDRIAEGDRQSFSLTDEEREALAQYPDLEEKVARYEEAIKPRLITRNMGGTRISASTPDLAASQSLENEFRGIQSSGYGITETVAASVAEVDEQLMRDREAAARANAELRAAIAAGAPRNVIQDLYMRDQGARERVRAEMMDVSGRGTYLSNRSRERLPRSQDELTQFGRLQDVERIFQDRPDQLFEYNNAIDTLDVASMTSDQYYQKRLQILQQIAEHAGMSDAYNVALGADPNRIPEDDTVANIPDDSRLGANTGEGAERATTIDPDEQRLLMTTEAQNKKEFYEWSTFSYVPPGHGLGGPARNPLERDNMIIEGRKLANAQKVPLRSGRMIPRARADPDRRQLSIPIYESDYGAVHFQDAFHNDYVDPFSKQVIWSDPYADLVSTRTVRAKQPIYDPDHSAYVYDQDTNTRYGRHATAIGEVSKPREYRFTDERYYKTNGYNDKYQNRLNQFAPEGDRTMISKDRAGLADRGIKEPSREYRHYGRTYLNSRHI